MKGEVQLPIAGSLSGVAALVHSLLPKVVAMPIMTSAVSSHEAGHRALALAQRRGFQLAIIGRSIAVTALAFVFLAGYHYPANLQIWAGTLLLGLGGLMALWTFGRPLEQAARYLFFAIDAGLVSALIAFAPLSSGDDIPQNLVFLTSRVHYYYLVIAASILTLSPRLVLWTGACCIAGLGVATLHILRQMDHVLTFGDLPYAPTRDVFNAVVLNANFVGTASRIEEALVMAALTSIAALAVHRAKHVVLARVASEEKRRHLKRQFGRYVPESVIAALEADGHLEPQQRNATLLFADIEGFTALSENMPPAELIRLLNQLFTAVGEVVANHGGLVVNYVGDAVIAAFNAPLPLEDHAYHATLAAREILRMVSERDFSGRHVQMRIGVATGPVAAGTVGSQARLAFTLYGDTVNLAQRLEALNKTLGTQCLICETTHAEISGRLPGLKALGPQQVRNRTRSVEVHALAV